LSTDISAFWEVMDLEMPDCEVVLTAKGYKLDGAKGLKTVLRITDSGGNTPKSVDYLQPLDKIPLFVEFSDLQAQHIRCSATRESLDLGGLSKSERNRVSSKISTDTEILNELRGKIVDTDFIFREISDKSLLDGLPELHGGHILVVWHQRSSLSKVDTAKLLEGLRGRLLAELGRYNLRFLNVPLHFLTVEAYALRYGCPTASDT
jgi:hypothetical protein